ncbi:UDP-galactose-4-epimerase [Flavobacterium oncorhynchi]|uniref:UDP-galactose-4-epimerase n=1 Tax=Flavobacterium oncorhynchi TaxID=728056 RepID=A0A226HUV9_9FLAO|nr:NAD-dependent epimerase/dehydratase family protein [Flavobacterium oncorhynchi]OXA97456.1 UDP-galactose-4-epimerase [Flavobacterium oncorhynchi]
MKVLLTGSTGFLGRNIIKVLKEQEYQIVTLGNPSTDIVCDISKELPNFSQSFNYVIHAAGKAHVVPKSDSEKQEFHDVNVKGTQNLLEGLERSNFLPQYFIFISSVSVYGLHHGVKIDENYPLLAKDAYGISKIKAEKIVQNWCDKNKIKCTILRLPLLVGINPPGNLGSMSNAIKKGYYFNIGGGKAKKSMVLAEDVAKFIIYVAKIGGVYHLTDSIDPNFKELSLAIAKINNKSVPLNMPIIFAKLLGKCGDIFGSKSPINSLKVAKICSELTFDDSKSRSIKEWKPNSVLEYIKKNIL